jgi:hypothetical protein
MAIVFDEDFLRDLEDRETAEALLIKLGIEPTPERLDDIEMLMGEPGTKEALYRLATQEPKYKKSSAKEIALIFP